MILIVMMVNSLPPENPFGKEKSYLTDGSFGGKVPHHWKMVRLGFFFFLKHLDLDPLKACG